MPALLRIPQLEKTFGIKRTAIYSRIRAGLLPAPIKYGRNVSIWPANEIEECCAAIIHGADDDAMRAIVRGMMEKRAAQKPRLAA